MEGVEADFEFRPPASRACALGQSSHLAWDPGPAERAGPPWLSRSSPRVTKRGKNLQHPLGAGRRCAEGSLPPGEGSSEGPSLLLWGTQPAEPGPMPRLMVAPRPSLLPVRGPPRPRPARTPTAGCAPADRWTDDGRPLPGPAGCAASPPPREQVSFKKPED